LRSSSPREKLPGGGATDMASDLLPLLGGIGLFLFGMQTMTVALRDLASQRARAVLARFTRTPLTGAITGAATTAAIQSSSATVMTIIGFVGAGLMTFPQALGVIFGANVGTTVTGWMVAILGLKLDLGAISLPLLLVAALVATLATGRAALAGRALAGFSLVFLGLGLMQAGTAALDPLLGRATSLHEGPGGLLLLVLVGVAVTAIVQSSSAGVAATLVLVNDGSLALVAAAALVIGMDLGTTLKSLVATLGGSVAMRRTAVAHVGYNLATALFALPLLALVPLLGRIAGDAPTALVIFHTAFNLVGVAVLLPLANVFSQLVERLVPERAGALPEPPDASLKAEPAAAVDAARVTAGGLAAAVARSLGQRLGGRWAAPDPAPDPAAVHHALDGLEAFLLDLALPSADPSLKMRYGALLHMVDHLQRLTHREGQEARLALASAEPLLARPVRLLRLSLEATEAGPMDAAFAARMARVHALIAGRSGRMRRAVLLREHVGLVPVAAIFETTDALRWLERVAFHLERIAHYAAIATGEGAEAAPPVKDLRRGP
jgi:phosphate:Na+ symporter